MGSKSPRTRSSSSASFYTANGSETPRSTAASSPAQASPCPYHEARQLPRELKEHCQIFLEEQLYMSAVNLLNSTLAAGLSRRAPKRNAVSIPPPSHLALLATLVVHPQHTTRADKPEHLVVSSLALDYLRNVLYVAGPINADFRTAFQFNSTSRWSRRSGHTAPASDSDMSDGDSDRDVDRLRGRMANEASVWTRGQDLWSTVGWAFNTATSHPQRWRYWKVWLEFILDVLDDDWAERERIDHEAHEAGDEGDPEPVASRKESMIRMYMEQQDGRQAGNKRIMKALLADGGSLSSSAFPEVFDKEPRGPRKTAKKRKRNEVLDLENDKYGDYLDDESMSSGISEPPTPEKRRDGRKDVPFGSSNPGIVESIPLRLRFFRLLSAANFVLCRRTTLNQLYEDFAVAIKVLPLQLFALFVTQRENPLLPETHVTITKELFHLLLPSKYKDPKKVDPEGDASGSLTMPMLEQCYAPLPANTVGLEDNAKLSLVVESAIQLLWMCDMVKYTDSFAKAVKQGIEARETKAKKKRTGKMRTDAGDVVAKDVLAASNERLHVLLEMLRMADDSDE
ncbi:hypothetical protein HIM_01696 [Hirsutella minnesotensis 3608]|nr:hypothetical protein HIM_01696 [Hirsutella minnesotensis 3608]